MPIPQVHEPTGKEPSCQANIEACGEKWYLFVENIQQFPQCKQHQHRCLSDGMERRRSGEVGPSIMSQRRGSSTFSQLQASFCHQRSREVGRSKAISSLRRTCAKGPVFVTTLQRRQCWQHQQLWRSRRHLLHAAPAVVRISPANLRQLCAAPSGH